MEPCLPLRSPARTSIVSPATVTAGGAGALWEGWGTVRRVLMAVSGGVAVVMLLLVGPASPGAAGNRTGTPETTTPARTSIWRQVSAGDRHTCAITLTGRLSCWGSDAAGQLGDGG